MFNKRKLILFLLCLGLVSCNEVTNSSSSVSKHSSSIIISSSSFTSSSSAINDSSSISINESSSSIKENSVISSSTIIKDSSITSSSVITSSSSSVKEPSSSPSKESSLISSSKPTVSSPVISSKVETYNPDGTVKLPIPTKSINSTWGQNGKFYEIDNEFPDGFSCIYGKQIIDTPPFYSTGSWKITYPNTGTRMGFQSPLFEEDLKLEVWFTVDEIHRNNDKLDKTNPWIRIYGFSKNGNLVTTKDIESPSNFTERDYHYAFNGKGVNYFELRFMSQPYEGSKCYNFGISEIGVKSFPYSYND